MKKQFSWMSLAAIVALVCFVVTPMARATALSANRDTPQREGLAVGFTQGSNTIYAGAMVAIDTNGVAVPAADTTGYNVIGRAAEKSDNTGASYLSTTVIEVDIGVFRWANGNSITDANVGDLVYALDDQTVKTSGVTNFIIAGVVIDVDTSGVWVDTKDIGAQSAITPASMAVSGAATVGATLGVTGITTLGGNLDVAGAQTNAGVLVQHGAFTANTNATLNGPVAAGDGGDTVAIDSSDWDIDATGAATGMGSFTSDGAATFISYLMIGTTTGTLSVVAINATNNLVFIVGTTTNIIDDDVDN